MKVERTLKELIEFIDLDNIAEVLSDDELSMIGQQVCSDYKAAVDSMADWTELTKKGLEIVEPALHGRSDPWEGASNFKSPALQNAAYRFGERASGELLRPAELVKSEVIGNPSPEKIERGERVSQYMSYQVNHEMPEWRSEQRKLLYRLPNMGTMFKKTFFDPRRGRLVTDLIQYPDFAVSQNTQSMEEIRDFTHVLSIKANEVESMKRADLWCDCDYSLSDSDDSDEDSDKSQSHDTDNCFLEQYCYYDLDGDGYEEPYIVTVHKASQKVARIVARFTLQDIIVESPDMEGRTTTVDTLYAPVEDEFGPVEDEDGEQVIGFQGGEPEIIKINADLNLTMYQFLPSADGTFLGVGYFYLMSALVNAINTGYNLLYDAGTLANLQGGWLAKGLRKKMGNDKFKPGEWKQTNVNAADLQQGVLPHQFNEPSPTLLQLVGDIGANLKEISASADIAEIVGGNTAATTVLMMIEETQSATTSLMAEQARSMGDEFQVMYKLNSLYADPADYMRVLDQQADFEADFKQDDLDLVPTADPSMSSKAQRIQQGQILMDQFDRIQGIGGDPRAVMVRFLESIGITDIQDILPEPTQEFMQAQAQAQQATAQAQAAQERFFNAQADALDATTQKTMIDAQVKMQKLPEEIAKMEAETIKLLEQAESEEMKNALSVYTAQFGAIRQITDALGEPSPMQPAQQPPSMAGAQGVNTVDPAEFAQLSDAELMEIARNG